MKYSRGLGMRSVSLETLLHKTFREPQWAREHQSDRCRGGSPDGLVSAALFFPLNPLVRAGLAP